MAEGTTLARRRLRAWGRIWCVTYRLERWAQAHMQHAAGRLRDKLTEPR